MSCPQLNSKNKGLGLLFKTILWHLFGFLSFVATDNKDGNGLKLERFGQNFALLMLSQQKIPKNLVIGGAFLKHFIRYSPHSLPGTFCA